MPKQRPIVFSLGMVTKRGRANFIPVQVVDPCVDRHRRADWGDVKPESAAENDRNLADDGMVISKYDLEDFGPLIVETNELRTVTLVYLAADY